MSFPIPNTNLPGYTLLSVGDGTDATYWGTGSGGPPSGTAGGDLSSTYPNPTVAKIQGSPVSTTAPTSSLNVMMWNGSNYIPTAISGDMTVTDLGVASLVKIQGYPIANPLGPTAGDYLYYNGSQWTVNTGSLSGDITGAFNSSYVSKLQGITLSAASPANGDVIQYSSGLGEYTAQPLIFPMGTGYAFTNGTSGTTYTITSTVQQVGATISVSGYTQYLVTLCCAQVAAASGNTNVNAEVNLVPYSSGYFTGAGLGVIGRTSSVASAYGGFSGTFVVTTSTTGSYSLGFYLYLTSATVSATFGGITWSVLGVR